MSDLFETEKEMEGMDQHERRVWKLIAMRKGAAQGIVGERVAALAGISHRKFRSVIRDLIMDHGKVIASGDTGYFIAITPDEILSATRGLKHRAIEILSRAARLQKVSLEEVFGQARMEFREED